MRLSSVLDTTFAICKRKVANHQHRRVREASKSGLGTSVWVTVGSWSTGGGSSELVQLQSVDHYEDSGGVLSSEPTVARLHRN